MMLSKTHKIWTKIDKDNSTLERPFFVVMKFWKLV